MQKKILLSIVGPTAVGKTSLSIFLAKKLKIDNIISCDSRQFYKEIKIGTAIPNEHELNIVKHHFIGHLSIHQSYTVKDFEKDVLNTLQKLFINSNIVLMVGGSGFYEKVITKGLDPIPKIPNIIRIIWCEIFKKKGINYLQEYLKIYDPFFYQKIDKNNTYRILRALEVIDYTGKPFSYFRKNKSVKRYFNIIKIGLTLCRNKLYKKINDRVDNMIQNGLIEEAKNLYKYKHLNILNKTIGYKEIFEFIEGKLTLSQAITKIKINTRHYAKRQITWYKHDNDIIKWFSSEEEKDKILLFIKNYLE
ncbi:MAG: tRNA (adenosine(37)-N6)-dimethylallyltransferase MiaA [Candidatus Bostrichicola ureolyticus]|nr:MAG: tRNA (adenosine(37)-N6)-dimethylallyltransferase MiaA [Candidatus Bostrichicola ureolyticus]